MRWFTICIGLLAAGSAVAEERFTFTVPGDDATASVTDLSGLSPGPAGADGFVRVRDGHFHTDAGRIRFWGVNTTFSANFPTHEQAEKAAAHLAKLGVNAVRMHHHDMQDAPGGIWGGYEDGRRIFDQEQLDRQDYFLDQLHRRGIYVNLNLHVSRTFTGREGFVTEGLPRDVRFDKYLLYFEPRMRRLFKEFCRDYLTHDNPYRRMRRVDDPAIAMLEITNENAFSTRGPGIAAELPEPYRAEFGRQWNAWLKQRYGTTRRLREAWGGDGEPIGEELRPTDGLSRKLGPWRLNRQRTSAVAAVFGRPGPRPGMAAVKLDIVEPVGEIWRQELSLNDLTVREGRPYTLSFWVRAEAPRSVYVDVSNQGPGDWRALGYSQTLEVDSRWRRVERVFLASETVRGNARLCFKIGGSGADLYLADVHLWRGGHLKAVENGQSLEEGNIGIPLDDWVAPAQRDVRRFMAETEAGFIREIIDFLKHDLGVKAPITASQINYHGAGVVAATCDYTDIHAYWQHPHFPGRPWDPANWRIPNTPMEREPAGDALLSRTPWRLLDRPLTLSEWNIPDPNDFAASAAPFAAMVAALQDWDGVFFFQYESSNDHWFDDRIRGYFSFNHQPVKLVMLSACANLYRRGDLAPLEHKLAGTLDQHLPPTLALSHRIGIDPDAEEPDAAPAPPTGRLASPDGRAVWDASDPDHAHVRLHTPATRGVWGLVAGRRFELGGLTLAVGPAFRDYAAIIVTSLDGRPLERSGRMLLAAVGSAQNRRMGWNADRTTVGNQWGEGPTQVNGITAEVRLAGQVSAVYALDGLGRRQGSVPVASGADASTWSIDPSHQTLWYEIVAE